MKILPNLPQLSTAVVGWSQAVAIGLVCKSQENYTTIESILTKKYRMVIQPLQPKALELKPEGQRGWRWLQIHAEPALQLQLDDIVVLNDGDRYRVMAVRHYEQYGYMEYELVRGYEYE